MVYALFSVTKHFNNIKLKFQKLFFSQSLSLPSSVIFLFSKHWLGTVPIRVPFITARDMHSEGSAIGFMSCCLCLKILNTF